MIAVRARTRECTKLNIRKTKTALSLWPEGLKGACQVIHIKGPPSFTNSLHTPTALPALTTESKITKRGLNIPGRHSNMP
jgi:hypothetical protein